MIEPAAIYTAKEVAAILRCGLANVYDLTSGGELAVIRVGAGNKGFRFKGSDLLAFLDERRQGGPTLSPSLYPNIGKYLARG